MNSSQQKPLDDVSLSAGEDQYLNYINMKEAEFNNQQQIVNHINSISSIYTLCSRIFVLLILTSLLFVVVLYYGVNNP